MRLPPRGVVRFLCWHVLKLEFWRFAHPQLNLRFVFASVFAVFSSTKLQQPAGCTVQKHAQLSISHRFFRCLCVCVAFRIGFYGVFADSRLFAHASLDLHLSFSSVQGWGGDGGGDDVHANAACVFCFFGCVISNAAKPLLPLLVSSLLKCQPCKNLEFLKLSRQKLRN